MLFFKKEMYMLITLDYLILNLLTNVQSKPNSHQHLLETDLGLLLQEKTGGKTERRRNLREREKGK